MAETVKESAASIRETIEALVMPASAAWRFSSSTSSPPGTSKTITQEFVR
ncbi:hypothetical protein ACH47Z_36145 [Streptomyces sp. NPDC020192]